MFNLGGKKMDFKCWEEIFRSLRESAAAGKVKGYRFGDYTVLDPESFKVITNKNVVRFSEFEGILDTTFSNRVKCVVRKIFSKKKFSKVDETYLLAMEKICSMQAEGTKRLPKEELFELVKSRTGLSTDENVKIYLENIILNTDAGRFLFEVPAM